MSKVKLPYYVTRQPWPNSRVSGYWLPSQKMKALGFSNVRCGEDGPLAWAIAQQWNARWQEMKARLRRGEVSIDPVFGDVAPARTIQGSQTGLTYPTGVFVDANNKEVWASNLGNSTATVYQLTANGDTPPLRIIRSAEEGKASLRFGKTQALVYDPIREEILVPN